jgi:long-chain acyl-CoA synthetase
MINRGGFKIFSARSRPFSVATPGVLECAIVGLPDPVLGERVHAFVVPRKNVALTVKEVREF